MHRHLSNIACLMVCTACLVFFISTVNGRSKKKGKKKKKLPWKTGATSGHITNLKQPILTFDIYASMTHSLKWASTNLKFFINPLWIDTRISHFHSTTRKYYFFQRLVQGLDKPYLLLHSIAYDEFFAQGAYKTVSNTSVNFLGKG
jgi:hypothetical protein